MREFVELHNLINLIKKITFFKGTESCIDLLLTNQKYLFENSNAFETGLSDHHLLIYSMLKFSFQKNEQKIQIDRDYISFSEDSFLTDLPNSVEISQSYGAFETKTVKVLGKYNNSTIPRKTKFLRGNHKRFQLKSIANKTGKDIGLYNFRKQRNLVVNINKKEKKEEISKFFVDGKWQ